MDATRVSNDDTFNLVHQPHAKVGQSFSRKRLHEVRRAALHFSTEARRRRPYKFRCSRRGSAHVRHWFHSREPHFEAASYSEETQLGNYIPPIPKALTQSGAVNYHAKHTSKPAIVRPSKHMEEQSAEPETTFEENEITNTLEDYFRRLKRTSRRECSAAQPQLSHFHSHRSSVGTPPDASQCSRSRSRRRTPDAALRSLFRRAIENKPHRTKVALALLLRTLLRDALSENRILRVNMPSIDTPDEHQSSSTKILSVESLKQFRTRFSSCANTRAQTTARASEIPASTSGSDCFEEESLSKGEELSSSCDTSETRNSSRNTSSSKETGENNHKIKTEKLSTKTSYRRPLSNTHKENSSHIQSSTLKRTEELAKNKVTDTKSQKDTDL